MGLIICYYANQYQNSLSNKIEVRVLVEQFKAQVIFLVETKIDATYPDSQFTISNYHLYRNDRVRGGGGLMAYFSSVLPSKRLKQPNMFKSIEVLLVQSKFGGKNVTVMRIYRSPEVTGENYYTNGNWSLGECIRYRQVAVEGKNGWFV